MISRRLATATVRTSAFLSRNFRPGQFNKFVEQYYKARRCCFVVHLRSVDKFSSQNLVAVPRTVCAFVEGPIWGGGRWASPLKMGVADP